MKVMEYGRMLYGKRQGPRPRAKAPMTVMESYNIFYAKGKQKIEQLEAQIFDHKRAMNELARIAGVTPPYLMANEVSAAQPQQGNPGPGTNRRAGNERRA